jgi:DNA mismatch repair protein MutL
VNDRFIKNNYLNHAVTAAFEELISRDSYPSYFLYLNLDPSTIDVNIHPTKTEIKFTEERSIYAIIHSAVRNSLGKYNISPSLDFEQEAVFNVGPLPKNAEVAPPETREFRFNPFETASPVRSGGDQNFRPRQSGGFSQEWKDLYSIREESEKAEQIFQAEPIGKPTPADVERPVFQLHKKYILTQIKSGFMMIDQRRAHERILFEEILASLDRQGGISQQQLFPQRVELGSKDIALIEDLKKDLYHLGFSIDQFGQDTLVVNGIPAEAAGRDIQALMEDFLEQYKISLGSFQNDSRMLLSQSMARSLCMKEGKSLSRMEMLDLIDRLFACEQPNATPSGKPIILNYSLEEIAKKFKA